MSDDTLDLAEATTVAYRRCDDELREVVDLGIALQQRSNTMTAVEYLRSQNVGHDVIERVLTEPGRRRAWSA